MQLINSIKNFIFSQKHKFILNNIHISQWIFKHYSKETWYNFFVLKNYTFIQFSPIYPFYYFIIQFSHFNSPKFNSFRISLSSKILQPVVKNHTLLLLPQSNSHNSLSTSHIHYPNSVQRLQTNHPIPRKPSTTHLTILSQCIALTVHYPTLDFSTQNYTSLPLSPTNEHTRPSTS